MKTSHDVTSSAPPALLRAADPAHPEAESIEPHAGRTAAPSVQQVRDEASRAARSRRGWLIRRLLVAADITALISAFAATEVLFRGSDPPGGIGVGTETVIFVLALPVWILAAKLYGLYDRDDEYATYSTTDEVVTVFHLVTVVVWLYYGVSWLFGLIRPDQAKLSTFWLLALLSLITARWSARTIARGRPAYVQRAIVVGAGDVGQLIGRKLNQHPEYRISLVGYIDAAPKDRRKDLLDVPHLGEPDDMVEIVLRHEADRVIFAFSQDRHEETLQLVSALQDHAVQIDVVPRLYEGIGPKTVIHRLEGLPLLGLRPTHVPRSSFVLKRIFDVVGASALLVLTAPLMLAIALLVRRDTPGPALFRQTRLGKGVQEFTMLKFRTMLVDTDEAPHREFLKGIMTPQAIPESGNLYKLDRSSDVTRVGRWLRRTSLDELPQLLNVIRGDMSLVGPRPSLPYELELFAPQHFERFKMPAGLTGLWQVEARAHSSWAEALDLDVLYVRSWSFGLDLRLLLRTPAVVLQRRETI